ncbi:MAG: TraB/GumN family protein [Gammaproteobacteria bacterium]|nr:TraB/GumN family protein [Gammaproteobacteria bacterium]
MSIITVFLATMLLASILLSNNAYALKPDYTATATFTGNPTEKFTVSEQSNKVAAAINAQQKCTQAHPLQNYSRGYCELTEANGVALTSVAQIKANVPKQPHPLFLWQYQSKTASVYLAGSVHILKPGLYPLPKPFTAAFEQAKTLVLEVDLDKLSQQELQLKAIQHGTLPSGQTLQASMSPSTYARFSAIAKAYGLPLAQMQQFKPAFISQQLAVMALMSVGYDPNQGVEKHFTAMKGERQVLELESVDFQLDLLMNQPLQTQVKMVEEMIDQMGQFEPLTAGLVTAWLSGDDQAFQNAFEAQSGDSELSKLFMHKLLAERNVGMANKIVKFLRSQGSYFVIIGSAHYVGNKNIIDLLAKKGIHGQRIYSNQVIKPL